MLAGVAKPLLASITYPYNWAKSANGGTATASTEASGYSAASAINGIRHTNNAWGSNQGWASGPDEVTPQWLEVNFGATRTIHEVGIFTLADAVNYNTDPGASDSFSLYGIYGYKVQTWNGSTWVDQITETANTKVWARHTGLNYSTSKIRIYVTGALSVNSRIVEVEAWQNS